MALVALGGMLGAFPLDGEFMAKRLYFHFYANNKYDLSRTPFVVSELPFTLTEEDYRDIFEMVDEFGNVATGTAVQGATADHVATAFSWSWVPQWARCLAAGRFPPRLSFAPLSQRTSHVCRL